MNTQHLLPAEQWLAPTLEVRDEGTLLSFHIRDALNYHGPDAVGGVVLGFRLLQKALACLSPQEAPERRAIGVFTAFPGLGARDCFELVTRGFTEGRYQVDTGFTDTTAQEGVVGRMHFRFSYRDQTVVLAPVQGAPSATFISLGRASKRADCTPQQHQQWRQAKTDLANSLLVTHSDDVIRVL